ncbi:MAG: TatD family hydrolase [Bacteroidota bacterium]
MNTLPFIDIHTHHTHNEKETVKVVNLFPGNNIPAFTGKNFFSVGLHPWKLKSKEENNSMLQLVEEALEFDHVIFAGECGLDKISGPDFDEQKRTFLAQALMAEEHQKPLIIHCVRAYNEILELYNNHHPSVPWILHGYTGSRELSEQLSKNQLYFSFGKVLFKEHARAIDSFKALPLEKIFLETDEFKGAVKEIYGKAAEIKNISVDALKHAVWNNFNRLENVSLENIK